MRRSAGDTAMRLGKRQQPLVPGSGLETVPLATDGPTLRNSRALVDDAVRLRESIRALLQSVPAPADF